MLAGLGVSLWLGLGVLSFGALPLDAGGLLAGLGVALWLGLGVLSLGALSLDAGRGLLSACDSRTAGAFGSCAGFEACELGEDGLVG